MTTTTDPFLVTVKRPVSPDDNGTPFCAACSHYHEGARACPDCGRPTPCRDHGSDRSVWTPATEVVSRVAVASLEEARDKVALLAADTMLTRAGVIIAIRESGGRVSLPDGTEIKVVRTTYEPFFRFGNAAQDGAR